MRQKHSLAIANMKNSSAATGEKKTRAIFSTCWKERKMRAKGVKFLLFSTLLISHDQGVVAGASLSCWPTRNIICILKQRESLSDIMQRRGAAGIASRTHERAAAYYIIFVFLHTRSASLPRDVGIRDRIITSSPRDGHGNHHARVPPPALFLL